MTGPNHYDAVLLHSFGGPEGPDDVVPFLRNVTRGRDIPTERLIEVGSHYAQFGGVSPINAHNRALQAAIQTALDAQGLDLPVYWGNRNWHPLLGETLDEVLSDGHRRVLAIVTSAFGSYSGCRQYRDELDEAVSTRSNTGLVIDKVRPFWNHPGFLDAMADRLGTAWSALDSNDHDDTALVFTAHSIPTAWVPTSPYVSQLEAAAAHLAERACAGQRHDLVFQSRSGPPAVPWLGPDVSDHLEALAAGGVGRAILVPLGFVSDHMEVVYDLDTVAAQRAAELDMELTRVPTVGTHSTFVNGLVSLVEEACAGAPPLAVLGAPWTCPSGCCAVPKRPS